MHRRVCLYHITAIITEDASLIPHISRKLDSADNSMDARGFENPPIASLICFAGDSESFHFDSLAKYRSLELVAFLSPHFVASD
jgi:hypothetical protein